MGLEDLSIVFHTVMLYPEFIINKMRIEILNLFIFLVLYQAISMKCSDLLNISSMSLGKDELMHRGKIDGES